MIIVKFFSSFCSSEECLERHRRVLQFIAVPQYGTDIVFTVEDNYTHAVLLNTAMPKLSVPKQNVLGLAFEPPYYLGLTPKFIEYAKEHIGQYYIGSSKGLPLPFVEHHGFMWHIPCPRVIADKTKLMSIIFSNKTQVPGHQYRHQLVRAILQLNLPIDVYGRGCTSLGSTDSRIKGSFDNEDAPYEGYQFSIAIENFSLPEYFSEKLINCIIHECTPLYYGAQNIEKYLPNSSIPLVGNLVTDLSIIRAVLKDPSKYKKTNKQCDILSKINIIDELCNLYLN